jgi:DNA-binding response OmpR family regulator
VQIKTLFLGTIPSVLMIHILHVDDETDFLDLSKVYLSKISQGTLLIDLLSDSTQIISQIRQKKYDIVICDYEMPEKNGLTVLAEIREEFGDLPVIFFTGRGREEVAILALNLGANFYIRKGYDHESQYLELYHKIQNLYQYEQTKNQLAEQYQKLVESEKKYRSLFDETPIAQVERDYSLVKAHLDQLQSSGVVDFAHYFDEHPDDIIVCAKMIKVRDLNQAALDLFKVKDKTEFAEKVPLQFMDQSIAFEGLKKQLSLFAKGVIHHETIVVLRIKDNDRLVNVMLHVPKEFQHSYARVWAKYIDITDFGKKKMIFWIF